MILQYLSIDQNFFTVMRVTQQSALEMKPTPSSGGANPNSALNLTHLKS